jgi:hypothetical protein
LEKIRKMFQGSILIRVCTQSKKILRKKIGMEV